MTRLDLTGLTVQPAQVWGGVRLVPLIRAEPIETLRLHARVYGDEPGLVAVDPRSYYISYIPHGFVATWTTDGSLAAAYGTELKEGAARYAPPLACVPLRFHRRIARRTDKNRCVSSGPSARSATGCRHGLSGPMSARRSRASRTR